MSDENLNYQECGLASMMLVEFLIEDLVRKGVIDIDDHKIIVSKTIELFRIGSDEQRVTSGKLLNRYKKQGLI